MATHIPKFEFVLTSSMLAECLTNHGLTPQQITSGRFKIQTAKLNFDLLQKASPKDIADTSRVALDEMIECIKQWPYKLDQPTFTSQVSTLLQHWLECYSAGTPIKVGLNLTNFIEFKLGFFSKNSYQFQLLLHDLIAECTSQFESYKFQYTQTHDTISGLANLQVLEKHLPQLFRNDGTFVGLLIIRMTIAASKNNARAIANAAVIKEISHIIRSYLAPGQLLFQVRRDEFAVSIAHLESQVALDLLATKLTRVIDVALHQERKVYEMSTIMAGICLVNHIENLGVIYDYAKLTLEDALSSNRQVAMYHSEVKQRADLYKQLQRDVIEGFEANNFELFLQPVVNIQLGKCINAEALLRWKNPNGQYVPPPTIIEIIYHQGLGQPFMRWLISTACRISSEIQRDLGYELKIAINLTADDLLDRDLPHLIMQQLSIWDVKAEDLTLEITETGLLADETQVENVMNELISIGCPLAIDDFGTGYSSMSRLRNMPVSSVKIDQSFVRHVAESDTDKTIVQTIATLAKGLNKETVAEGVEDLACLEVIKSMGCTKVQGYYYSKPVSVSECVAWVKNFNEMTR
ncbi:MAG TPA: GGDEF domain-containing phosphodiesterase [Methylophilaceae bacterium]|jgi:EAL domain-containing protein (putative c-di-GMP-specific phosphodiesterase class I)/GGDEF domain-containing protein